MIIGLGSFWLFTDALFSKATTRSQTCPFTRTPPVSSRGGGGTNGGHVLRETTSRGLCGLVCPSRTSERGGEGDRVAVADAYLTRRFKFMK